MQWFWVPSVHHNYLGNMWVPEKHKKLSSGVIREPDGALQQLPWRLPEERSHHRGFANRQEDLSK